MKLFAPPAPHHDDTRLVRVAALTFITAAVVGALYFGRDVLIPAAIAILLAFILGPAVTWLRRYLPKSIAVALVVLGAGLVIGALAALVTTQLAEVANSLTTYQANLTQKIRDIRGLSQGTGFLSRFMEMVASLATSAAPEAAPPQIVRLESDGSNLASVLAVVAPLLHPVLTVGVVGILVIFILLDRDHLSDQFVRVFGAGDVLATSSAIEDAGSRVARVLTLQLLTNFGFAVFVAGGLYALGLPNPVLWGVLAGGFRFIPYVGTVLGALLPTLIAFAVMPGWSQPFLVLGLIVGGDLIIGQLIEPLLFGGSTGLTPLALIMSAIFWGALWGPIGLLLSTPLAICMLVIGRHVSQLGFLGVLLGAAPVLEPYQQIYRRLMRNAVVDASAVALAEIETNGRERGLDSSMGRMLALAEADRMRERLSATQAEAIVEGTQEMLEIIAADTTETAEPAAPSAGPVFACVGGRGGIDDAAALLVAFALRRAGTPAVSRRRGEKFADDGAKTATFNLICYASPPSEAIRRYTSRKITQESGAGRTLHLMIDYGADSSRASVGVDARAGDVATLVRLATQEAVVARTPVAA